MREKWKWAFNETVCNETKGRLFARNRNWVSPYELLSRRESISDRPRPESPLLTRHEPDKMGQQATRIRRRRRRRRRKRRGFAESKSGKMDGPASGFLPSSLLNIPRSSAIRDEHMLVFSNRKFENFVYTMAWHRETR